MGDGIKIESLDKLQKALKENATLDDVREIVRRHGRALQGVMTKNAGENTFNKGYFTGTLKQDVAASGYKESDMGMSVSVGTTKEYGPYLEYGTRFMEKEQFVKPSLDAQEPKFKADMKKLVK